MHTRTLPGYARAGHTCTSLGGQAASRAQPGTAARNQQHSTRGLCKSQPAASHRIPPTGCILLTACSSLTRPLPAATRIADHPVVDETQLAPLC